MTTVQHEKTMEILFNYGFEPQTAQAVEELLELATLLQKSRRKNKMNQELCKEICSEIADVCIMIDQLKVIFDHLKIAEMIDQKLNRELARIKNTNK